MLCSDRSLLSFFTFVVLGSLFALTSCSESPTSPAPRGTAHHEVMLVVTDSLGAPAADAEIQWNAQFVDAAGYQKTIVCWANERGTCSVSLDEGAWVVVAHANSSRMRVAGSGLHVGPSTGSGTPVLHVTLHTASRATGTVRLAGHTDLGGTIVSSETGGLAVTDADGAFSLNGLPLGSWQLKTYRAGFAPATVVVSITTPGSSVEAAPMRLVAAD
jgi:hypothetical protein